MSLVFYIVHIKLYTQVILLELWYSYNTKEMIQLKVRENFISLQQKKEEV
jgi:hypothetical protein